MVKWKCWTYGWENGYNNLYHRTSSPVYQLWLKWGLFAVKVPLTLPKSYFKPDIDGDLVLTKKFSHNKTALLQKIYSDFELQGIDDECLNSKVYQTIQRRIQFEEANNANKPAAGKPSSSTSNSMLFENATQAVSSVGSIVEGAGAKMFSFFKWIFFTWCNQMIYLRKCCGLLLLLLRAS